MLTMIQAIALVVFFGGLVLFIIAMSLFDYWLYEKFGVDSTISRAIERLGYYFPLFIFLFGLVVGLVVGILAGHFFWSQPVFIP